MNNTPPHTTLVDRIDDLFFDQCAYTARYLADVAQSRRYSDDDTDYINAALDTCRALLTFSYDCRDESLIREYLTAEHLDPESKLATYTDHVLNELANDCIAPSLAEYLIPID